MTINSIGVFVFAAISPFGIALGQTASGSPIVGDVAVASGPERVLFLGTQRARAGGVHQRRKRSVNGSRKDLTWACPTHRMEPLCSASATCRPMPTHQQIDQFWPLAPIWQFG
jgi:hypothetical protein